MLTRRHTTKLILSAGAASALPSTAYPRSSEEWAALLQATLRDAARPGCGTRLTLTRFGFRVRGRRAGMSAVIRMDWPPGVRTRRVDASETGEDATFQSLLAGIRREFGSANPGCVI